MFLGDAAELRAIIRGKKGALRVPRAVAERRAAHLRAAWKHLHPAEQCIRRSLLLDLADNGDPDAIGVLRWLDEGGAVSRSSCDRL